MLAKREEAVETGVIDVCDYEAVAAGASVRGPETGRSVAPCHKCGALRKNKGKPSY